MYTLIANSRVKMFVV